jgi:hypothetical protein
LSTDTRPEVATATGKDFVVPAAAEGMDELLRFLMLIDAEGVELAEAKLVLAGEGAGFQKSACVSDAMKGRGLRSP